MPAPTSVPARAFALPLVVALWLAVPLTSAWYAWIAGASFFGEAPTAGYRVAALLLWTLCVLAATLLPLAGAAVAGSLSWPRTARAFRLMSVLGAVAVAALLLWLYV